MSATTASERGPDGAAPEPRSRVRRLVHLYTSPDDRTPTWVGVVIGLLAVAGIRVLGSTSQLWLLACVGLLVYAVTGVVRPLEAWRILRDTAGPASPPRPDGLPTGSEPPGPDEPDSTGWLPSRRSGRR